MWNIRNRVQLVWVPGHIGNKGNEIEDGLAKEGVSCPFTGPGLALASDRSDAFELVVRYWLAAQHLFYWKSILALRQAKVI